MSTDRTAALLAALSTVLPTVEPTPAQMVPKDAIDATGKVLRAYCLLYGGSPVPQVRKLDGEIHMDVRSWQAVVVSNSARGARLMADRVLAAVDNRRFDGARAVVSLVTTPLLDDDAPGDYRWLSTVEIDIRD